MGKGFHTCRGQVGCRGIPGVRSWAGAGQKGAGSPRVKQLCPDVAQRFLLPQRQALGVKGGDLQLAILYASLSWGGKCQASSWESGAGYPAHLPGSAAGREVGNLKETGSALLLLRCLPCRDLAHSRILKLEGFKKKGEISRDDRANVNSPSYMPVYLSVHVSMHPAV